MRRIGCLLIFVVVASLAVWPQALPQTQTQRAPKIITIEPPFPGTWVSAAYGINDVGAITGVFIDADSNVNHGFLRTPAGKYIRFDAPGGGTGDWQGTQPASINLFGAITGAVFDDNYVEHAFLRTPTGKYVVFDAPGAGDNSTGWHTHASAINLSGTIAGWLLDEGMNQHAFLRAPDGTFITYEGPDAGTGPWLGSQAVGINDWGLVSGNSAVNESLIYGTLRKPDGNFITFNCSDPTLIGANGIAVNWFGYTVGYCHDVTYTVLHAILVKPGGEVVMVEPPSTPTETVVGSQGWSINMSGTVTGFYWDANKVTHGFVRTPDGKFTRFDAPGAGTASDQGTWPQAINYWGQVVGYYMDANGVYHGFLRMGDK